MTARYRQRETPAEGRDHGHGKPLKSKSFWRRGGWTCAKTLTGTGAGYRHPPFYSSDSNNIQLQVQTTSERLEQ